MRKPLTVIAAVAALTACGADTDDTSTKPEMPEASASTTTPSEEPAAPERTERGTLAKQLGEEGGLTGPDGADLVTFAVDAITPGVQCTEPYASPPENGHLTAVQLRVATSPAATADTLGYLAISGYDWSFVGPDGLTFTNVDTAATYGCLPEAQMFPQDQLSPGSQYAGTILLDLPAPTGILIYKPMGVDGGWEWQMG